MVQVFMQLLTAMTWLGRQGRQRLTLTQIYQETNGLGFPKTDENHYLTGTSANEASAIFRSVANSILPYTKGTKFGDENAYAKNGIAPVDTSGTNNTTNQSDNRSDVLKDVQDKAKNLVDQAKKAIDDAKIPEKAQNFWDTVKSWFQ